MDDLISRKAAIEYLMTNMGWHDEDGYSVDDADEKRKIITDLVNGVPAVDAVSVVRCKDCKQWYMGLCCRYDIYVGKNHFCADGERRDEDADNRR